MSRGYYGVYDEAVLAKDVLPNTNTIVGEGGLHYQDLQKRWKARGGKWYIEHNLPTFARTWINPDGTRQFPDLPTPLTADSIYDYWTQSLGFTNPLLDGI